MAYQGGAMMIDWIIGGIVLVLVVGIVVKKIKDIKKGKSCCGCECCASKNACCDKQQISNIHERI